MEHASFNIAKNHRKQVLGRVEALGLTYKEERSHGAIKCTVLGSQEQLHTLQASIDEYWRQVYELEQVTNAGALPRGGMTGFGFMVRWHAASKAAKGGFAVVVLAMVAAAVYFIGSPWSAEGKAIKAMQTRELSYTDFANLPYDTLAGDMHTVCQNLNDNGWDATVVGMRNAVQQTYYDDTSDGFRWGHSNMALHDSAVIMRYAVIVDCPSFKSHLPSLGPYIDTDTMSPDYPGFPRY